MYCPECNTEEGTPHKENCSLKSADIYGTDSQPPKPFTQKEVEQEVEEMEKILLPNTNGDAYDEDEGTYLGQLTNDVDTMCSLPAQISIFYEGYWYIFKPQSRYKEEKEGEKQT